MINRLNRLNSSCRNRKKTEIKRETEKIFIVKKYDNSRKISNSIVMLNVCEWLERRNVNDQNAFVEKYTLCWKPCADVTIRRQLHGRCRDLPHATRGT